MGNYLVRLKGDIEQACEDYMKKYNYDGIGYGLNEQRSKNDFFAGARWGISWFENTYKVKEPTNIDKRSVSDG
jgi:hypothetical protein